MKPSARCAIALAALVACSGASSRALGQTVNLDRARALTEAAARAYALGKYDFAIQALEQELHVTTDDTALFSIAEAHRQRYALTHEAHDLTQAVAYYRRYLATTDRGEHRAEAERALAALEQVLASTPASEPTAEEPAATRLSVIAPELGAVVRIDGGPAQPLPLFTEIAPGRHVVAVEASGYLPFRSEIRIDKGFVYPVTVRLEPEPAKLLLETSSGATVHVDGRLAGTTPLAKPIALDPGEHFVAVTRNGFSPHGETVRLERGKLTKLSVDLEATRQRKASLLVIGGSGAVMAGGIVLGVLSVVELRKARSIERQADARVRTADQQRQIDAANAARDDFRVGAGIAGGVGLGLFVLGGALLVFENEPPVPRGPRDAAPRPILTLSPRIGGGNVALRF